MQLIKNIVEHHLILALTLLITMTGLCMYFVLAFYKTDCEKLCGEGGEVLTCNENINGYKRAAGCVVGQKVCLRYEDSEGHSFDQMCVPKQMVNLARARELGGKKSQ